MFLTWVVHSKRRLLPLFSSIRKFLICVNLKNGSNLEIGNSIAFTQYNKATNNIANAFNIESDLKLINILKTANEEFPEVKNFLEKISHNIL